MAPQGLSSESEASAAQVAEIINQIKADGVKTWFMENQLDPRLVKQIASATGAQPGGTLPGSAVGKRWRGGYLRQGVSPQCEYHRRQHEITFQAGASASAFF
jgi:ABC-type Zn uptake system ZnuABC Zn-binding protein ZnuA